MKKLSIGKTILYTILILVAITVFGLSTLILFFPKFTGDVCYDLGWNKLTIMFYMRDYNSSNDINTIMNALDLSIKEKDYNHIIKTYEKASDDEKYSDYINSKNLKNYSLKNIDVVTKSALINEGNYYFNKYIIALKESNQTELAMTKSIEELYNAYNLNFNYKSLGNYSISALIKDNLENINIQDNNILLETNLLNCLVNYYDKLYNQLENTANLANKDNIYFINFCSRLLNISNDIIYMYDNSNQEIVTESKITNIKTNIEIINAKILEVL